MANKATDRSSNHHLCVFSPLLLKISDIESRIAALSAAGLTVKSVEKAKRKSSVQVSTEGGGCEVPAPRCTCSPGLLLLPLGAGKGCLAG